MKIGIIGITGRVGTILTEMISADGTDVVSGGVSSKSTPQELESVIRSSDVLIDFSTAEATLKAAEVAAACKVPFVSGTSIAGDTYRRLEEFSRSIPLLHSCNFGICVHLMASLLRKCAKILPNFDVSIIDKHHNRKKDAPSCTASFLADQVGKKAQVVSIRSGSICGDHTCDFIGEDEMLTISHRAFNRKLFASGALSCAQWIVGKSPKFYSMNDFLEDKISCPE